MHNVSMPKFGCQIAVYKVLDKRDILNNLAKRVTAGAVSRDTLAQKIISNTVSVAQQYAINNKVLGKRSAEISHQGRSVLFNNTFEQVKNGVGPLVELILKSKGQSAFAQRTAAGIAQWLGPKMLQDHALERVLVALKEREGGENALKMALDNALTGVFGGKIISNTFMSALKRAILDRKEFKPNSPFHEYAAWKLHQHISPDPSLLSGPPRGWQTIEAIVDTLPGFVTKVCAQLDNIQDLLHIPRREQKLSTVITECWPSDLAVTGDIANKDFARIVLMAHETGQQNILDDYIACLPEGVRDLLQQQCATIRDLLAKIPEPEVNVVQNWSGGIESVSVNHDIEHSPTPKLADYINNRFRTPVHHPEEIAAYFADGAFINAFRQGIDLKVDNSHQSYARWAAELGSQVISQAKNVWGNQKGITSAQQRQLKQLSDLVDNSPLNLMALSRYLIPESIIQSAQTEIFKQFTRKSPDLVWSDGLWMKVGEPEVSFAVSKKEGVNIAATLKWPVTAFGKTPDALETSQNQRCNITSTVNINMLFNQKGLEKQQMTISNTHIALREELVFSAPAEAERNTPITFLDIGVLKSICDISSTC